MKNIFFIIAVFALSSVVKAQEPADALRYSWNVQSGTARQQAVGGAMGSLGGDLSATYVNPAGLGFYKTGDFVLSPGFRLLKNKSTYLGRTETDDKNSFALGTTGIVLGGSDRKTKSSAFAIAVNRTASFGSNILYRGENSQSSYSQQFLEEIGNIKDANSVAADFPFGTSLAFNTFWIDTVGGGTSGNFQFQSRARNVLLAGGSLLQEQVVNTKGGITEFALAGALNRNDKFYFGATLGIPILNYERESTFTEADASADPTNKFDFATISEDLRTSGAGINLKAGIIFKPVEYVRLGLAVHSPSFLTLTDRYSAQVTTNTENYEGQWDDFSDDYNGGAPSQFKYFLVTPYRLIASASYVLREIEDIRKQRGFLTADIEYVNYKASSFHEDTDSETISDPATKDYLKSLNDAIDNAYKGAFNFRVGGELKFTTIMVRAGAAYYGNPYKNISGEKGNRLLFSGGLGYRHKGFFIDGTYVHNIIKDAHAPYRLQSMPYQVANIKGTGGNIVVTVGFKI